MLINMTVHVLMWLKSLPQLQRAIENILTHDITKRNSSQGTEM